MSQAQKKWGDGVYNLISWFDIEKVGLATVMVVGSGALGNEVLKNLALLGIGHIIVIDFDRIEFSNLTRSILFRPEDAELQSYKSEIAARRIKEINPEIKVTWLNGDIEKEVGLGFFRGSDVIIGCLDSINARYFLNNYAFLFNKPWIDGGIRNLDGHASVYSVGNSCYACSLSDEARQNMTIREGCADVFQESSSFGRVATTPISSSIIGAIQVQEALKIIHGYKDNDTFEGYQVCRTLQNHSYYYEGMNLDAYSIIASHYIDNCPHHDVWTDIIEDYTISTQTTIHELFSYFETQYNDEIESVQLRNPFISDIIIQPGGRKYAAMIPDSKVEAFILKNNITIDYRETAYKLPSPEGGYNAIDKRFEWKDLTLGQIGVPKFDILHIESKTRDYYMELSSEKSEFEIFRQ